MVHSCNQHTNGCPFWPFKKEDIHPFFWWLVDGGSCRVDQKRLLCTATLGTTEECRMQSAFGCLPSGNSTWLWKITIFNGKTSLRHFMIQAARWGDSSKQYWWHKDWKVEIKSFKDNKQRDGCGQLWAKVECPTLKWNREEEIPQLKDTYGWNHRPKCCGALLDMLLLAATLDIKLNRKSPWYKAGDFPASHVDYHMVDGIPNGTMVS